jgi:hypothetical protein
MLDPRDAPWADVQRPADRCQGNRFFSVRGRPRRGCVHRCGRVSAGPCILRGNRRPERGRLGWVRAGHHQDRRVQAAALAHPHAGRGSATFHAE